MKDCLHNHHIIISYVILGNQDPFLQKFHMLSSKLKLNYLSDFVFASRNPLRTPPGLWQYSEKYYTILLQFLLKGKKRFQALRGLSHQVICRCSLHSSKLLGCETGRQGKFTSVKGLGDCINTTDNTDESQFTRQNCNFCFLKECQSVSGVEEVENNLKEHYVRYKSTMLWHQKLRKHAKGVLSIVKGKLDFHIV